MKHVYACTLIGLLIAILVVQVMILTRLPSRPAPTIGDLLKADTEERRQLLKDRPVVIDHSTTPR